MKDSAIGTVLQIYSKAKEWDEVESYFAPRKLLPPKGRMVALFPDLGSFADWQHLADRLCEAGARVKVNDQLEQHATEDEQVTGLDLADYLLREQPKAAPIPRETTSVRCHRPQLTGANWSIPKRLKKTRSKIQPTRPLRLRAPFSAACKFRAGFAVVSPEFPPYG